jgi:hypothetical protein
MNGLGPGLNGDLENTIGFQVTLNDGSRPQEMGFGSLAHMQGIGVCLGMYRDGLDAQGMASTLDTNGDLASVGDQDFFEHGGTSLSRASDFTIITCASLCRFWSILARSFHLRV